VVRDTEAVTAVIDIPDELYRKMAERVASLGRDVPDVTVELYEQWLKEVSEVSAAVAGEPAGPEWLEDWFKMADDAMSRAPSGPSARENVVSPSVEAVWPN